MRADQVVVGHAGDREHGLPVQLRVVEAVEQMEAAGPGRREADAEPAGELRIAARHEGGRLFVAHLDEADRVLALAQRLHDAVDAVAGQAEDGIHAPVLQHVDQNVGGCLSHGIARSAKQVEVPRAALAVPLLSRAPPMRWIKRPRAHGRLLCCVAAVRPARVRSPLCSLPAAMPSTSPICSSS